MKSVTNAINTTDSMLNEYHCYNSIGTHLWLRINNVITHYSWSRAISIPRNCLISISCSMNLDIVDVWHCFMTIRDGEICNANTSYFSIQITVDKILCCNCALNNPHLSALNIRTSRSKNYKLFVDDGAIVKIMGVWVLSISCACILPFHNLLREWVFSN